MPKPTKAPASPDTHFGYRYNAAAITSPTASTVPTHQDDPSTLLRGEAHITPKLLKTKFPFNISPSHVRNRSAAL